jgi:hypothetical protein
MEEQGGDGSLAVTQAAIARADAAMLINLEAIGFQLHAQQTRQPSVVHAASAQRDLSHACCRARKHSRLRKGIYDCHMKSRSNALLADVGAQVLNQRAPQ